MRNSGPDATRNYNEGGLDYLAVSVELGGRGWLLEVVYRKA